MKNVKKTIRSSIIKMVASVIIAIIGICLAISFTDIIEIVGIVLAVVGGIGLFANGIVLAIAKMNKD